MALFTPQELSTLLRREVDMAGVLLARTVATGLVARELGQPWGVESAELTQTLDVDMGRMVINLPRRPVTAVAEVAIDGTALAEADWEWKPGKARVWLLATPSWSGVERVAEVTYTAGWTSVPDDVRAVALSAAARIYVNPEGLRSMSIDDYSETRAGADDDLAGVSLLKGERAILASIRRSRSGSVSTW